MGDYEMHNQGVKLPTYKQRENAKILSAIEEQRLIDMLFESIAFD